MAPCRQFKYIDASRLPGLKTGGCELQEHDCNKESTGNDEMIASALDSRGNKEFIGGSYVLRKKAHGEANERKKGKKKTNEWFDVPGDAELRKKKDRRLQIFLMVGPTYVSSFNDDNSGIA
ncbi:unnamed protein product [Cuscuta epithymum]|uniref:Uncharacterized protein n=1 Tax=Cuscuta epithymum TaxID=186058 RepID=A0AAV0DII9_9ASTE|nr:unnamed protein product [Cuscuta epithymum]